MGTLDKLSGLWPPGQQPDCITEPLSARLRHCQIDLNLKALPVTLQNIQKASDF